MKAIYNNDNIVLINFTEQYYESVDEILNGKNFYHVLKSYLGYLRQHNYALYKWAAKHTDEHANVTDLIHLAKILYIFDLREIDNDYLGGPGVGKTTLAAELFTRLKIMGYEVENVSEFAKELVWEERSQAFNDRLYMHAEQNHRLLMMQGKLDFIITDSPLILTSVYNSFYLKNVHSDSYNAMIDLMVKETWNLYDNRVFLLERNNDYHALGRRENENEAKIIDNYLLAYLIQNNISYTTIKDRNNAVHEILEGLRLV